MFWCQASLLNHHALKVPCRPGVSVHCHACLTWGKGQLLGPLQSLHQMWVRPLGSITSWIRVGGTVPTCTDLRHHVGWRNATLLHTRMHGARVIHEARHHVRSRDRRVLVLRRLDATVSCSSIMTVKVQDFFWAFRLLRALFESLIYLAATSIGLLCAFEFLILWASRLWSFRYRARRYQTSPTGALRAQ